MLKDAAGLLTAVSGCNSASPWCCLSTTISRLCCART